ncbi:MAG: hypothetical protein ACOC4H_02805 [bacterium]
MKKLKVMAAVFLFVSAGFVVSAAAAENPYMKPDESWISISGTVDSARTGAFELDYGDGKVTVEMDGWGWKWYEDSLETFKGDKVTVYGRVDKGLFEDTTIEAGSIYVQDIGAYYYANAADDEGDVYGYDYWVQYDPFVIGNTHVRGTVTDVNGREFTINTGDNRLEVDTSMLPYNPMDDIGFQKIDEGDYVSVTGIMDYDFWNNRELVADKVVMLVSD